VVTVLIINKCRFETAYLKVCDKTSRIKV